MAANMGMIGLAMASGATQNAQEWEKYASKLERRLDKTVLVRAVWDASHHALEAVLEDINGGPLTDQQRALDRERFSARAREMDLPELDQYIPERFR